MPFSNPLLPSVPDGLHVDDLKLDAAGLLINERTTAAEAPCPSCGRSSTRVHSTYWRTLKDLPWQDRAVTWHIKVRRFRCSHCPGRVFAERVPGFSARKARRSDRLAAAQADIGMVLGGEPGARLSRRLAMPVSGDTVLRLIRQREIEPCPPPRVVGIDDWAWRRGRSYGTIVCDLERRRVIDLLPSRSAGPVRDWLAARPSVRVISRDRSGPYAEAARTGAPTATQVADRWHLLVNASDVLRRIVERHQTEIRHAARQCVPEPPAPTSPTPTAPVPERSGRRRARCEAALRLHGEGVPIKDIARRLSASRNGVRRWVRAGHFVSYHRAPDPSQLDRHLALVEARWQDGERNATTLHRELRALGFAGGYDIIRRWAARRRQGEAARLPSARIPSAPHHSLHGRKRLVTGNHDDKNTLALPWLEAATQIATIRSEGRRLVLCHYGMLVWPGQHGGALHLYGQSHGRLPGHSRALDVGVDCWGYAPVRLEQIVARMAELPAYVDPEAARPGIV